MSRSPAADATGVSSTKIYLEIWDDDSLEDGHMGGVVLSSIQISVHDGIKWRTVVVDGEVQDHDDGYRYEALLCGLPTLTGTTITGSQVTGRWMNRQMFRYEPREFFADGETIQVRVQCEDLNGNELDETYSFVMAEWSKSTFPEFTIETTGGDGPFDVIPIFHCVNGTERTVSSVLYWGKDDDIELNADDVLLTATVGDSNATGLEVLGEGALSLSVDGGESTVIGSSTISLGSMDFGASKELAFTVSLGEGAVSEGPVSIEFTVEPRFAEITGRRITGSEGTGSLGSSISGVKSLTFHLLVICVLPSFAEYLSDHSIV